MEITYDNAKNGKKILERDLAFESAREFSFDTAVIHRVWKNGESRLLATGFLNEQVHVHQHKVRDWDTPN